MAGQIDYIKSTPSTPDANYVGIGVDTQGFPYYINEDGTITQLIGTSGNETVVNTIANAGVGLFSNIPIAPDDGDIYVGTDTLKIYIYLSLVWQESNLTNLQFVTDTINDINSLYQFDGVELRELTTKYSNDLSLTNVISETVSGIPTTQQGHNEEITALYSNLEKKINESASANGNIEASPTPVLVTTVEQELDFSIINQSNNTDIFEFDDVNNRTILKRVGRYQFETAIRATNSSGSERVVTIYSYSDELGLLSSRDITVPKNSTAPQYFPSVIFVNVDEGDTPQTTYATFNTTDNGDVEITEFTTIVTATGVQGIDTDVNVKVSANDTIEGYLSDKQLVGNEFTNEIENSGGNENLRLKFKGWIYNAGRTFYSNIISLATANRDVYLQDKDHTIAGIDDIKDSFIQTQVDRTSTGESDPGSGKSRLNNSDQSLVTELYINENEYGGGNIGDFIGALSADSIIGFKAINNRAKWVNYKVISVTDNTGWWTVGVSVENKGTDFANDDVVGVSLITPSGLADTTGELKITAADTTKAPLNSKLLVGDEFVKTIQNPGGNENILLTFSGRVYNALRTFYHTIVSNADANYTATLPNKSGTFAFLDDIPTDYDISFALSDETSDLTTDNDGQIKVIREQTISSITFAVNTAPTGSSILVDVLKNGTTILTGAITLPVSSTSVTVTAPQISTTSLSDGDVLKADITQIGATIAGAGAKIYFKTDLV